MESLGIRVQDDGSFDQITLSFFTDHRTADLVIFVFGFRSPGSIDGHDSRSAAAVRIPLDMFFLALVVAFCSFDFNCNPGERERMFACAAVSSCDPFADHSAHPFLFGGFVDLSFSCRTHSHPDLRIGIFSTAHVSDLSTGLLCLRQPPFHSFLSSFDVKRRRIALIKHSNSLSLCP